MAALSGKHPYKCNLCDMSFGWTEHLKQHMDVHSDGNAGKHPYKCNLCDSSFGICDALEQHMLSHTVKHQYKCNISNICLCNMYTGEYPYQFILCYKI